MIVAILSIILFVLMPFIFLVVLIYLIFTLFLFQRFKIDSVPDKIKFPNEVSVIIPFRNEASSIINCINALKNQKDVKLEIIFVNDHSDDLSVELIQAHSDGLNIKILHSDAFGKKAALTTGINSASYSVIWTTDADCILNNGTLKSMLNHFHFKQLNMLCGLVQLEGKSIFQKLQQAESAALVGISAFFLNEGRPATCNGANLMFKKDVFYFLNGYDADLNTSSGDDDLLMHRFAELSIDKVRYHCVPNELVSSNAESTLIGFLNQRARWASKHKLYRFPYNQILLALMAFKLLAFFILLFFNLFFFSYWFIIPFLVLLSADFFLAYSVRKLLKFKMNLIFLLPFYQLYIPFAWLKSKGKNVFWKGRLISVSNENI